MSVLSHFFDTQVAFQRPVRHCIAPGLLILLITAPVFAAPKADLWERWTVHDPRSTTVIDHSPWDRLLKRYLIIDDSGVNRVRYAAVGPQGRKEIDAYVEALQAVPVSRLRRSEQEPFWINLYNALTIQVVLDHYPVASIRDIDISPGWFSDGPWGKKIATIEKEQLSLDDIEHRILRPIWKDPRIHYALNCAAVSCPNLRKEAFTAANTEKLLNQGAREYINDPRGVYIHGDRLVASSIYKWYQEDFGSNEHDVIAHLSRYAEPGLRVRLRDFRSIDDYRYDWALNDAR